MGRSITAVAFVAALLLAGCGADPKPPVAPSPPPAPAASGATDAPTDDVSLPPGAQAGLDDYDGDGRKDPTCSVQDFGGGLALRIPCEILNANEPVEGTRLVKDSLFRLPAFEANLDDVSASLVTSRDTAGVRVVVVVFNSDNLFATGRDQLSEGNNLDAVIRVINATFGGGPIQVRGHTDGTGAAAANQALSERRAATMQTYLTGHGVRSSAVTAAGFGSSRPLVEETGPDVTAARAFNRRVELAIRLP
jgi:outer membrane protein OmpA-like peptidoglycan-associated protein